MQQAIELFSKVNNSYNSLAETVLSYCNIGVAKYPDCQEWEQLRTYCALNMAYLSKLIAEGAKSDETKVANMLDLDDVTHATLRDMPTRADVAHERFTDEYFAKRNA